jgi:uncharacterized LabA/DUF88 family protein
VAGAGDFLPLMEQVKRTNGRVVVLAGFANGPNQDVRLAADEFFDMTNHFASWWEGHLRELNEVR